MEHPVKKFPIFAAFEESGHYDLLPEFVETLVNDEDVPRKLRRQIWTLASVSWEHEELVVADIVAHFQDSEEAQDLVKRWEKIVQKFWPLLPNIPLKREIDALK